jgi:hypothetical protein
MTTIAIPSALADVLRRATLPARLVDEHGTVLGSFAPLGQRDSELSPEELAELKRRMTSPGPRFSTEEVLAYIDAREKK